MADDVQSAHDHQHRQRNQLQAHGEEDEPAARVVEETHEVTASTREERIQFLTHAIAFAETNIRAYDTKSQIALAAFVFSMTPLWSTSHTGGTTWRFPAESVDSVRRGIALVGAGCT